MVSPIVLLTIVIAYFAVLIFIAQFTGKSADSQTFFNAKRQSNWVLVAIGMIGASLSGVTFISIPGVVGAGGLNQSFSYMQMVFGYLIGYFVIAAVLLPIYYKYNLTSIYGYLEERFGRISRKIGAFYFLLSRIIGASFRLFLVALVFETLLADIIQVPSWVIVSITIVLIWVYTYRGGIKTIVVTDVLQTCSMFLAVFLTIFGICGALGFSVFEIPSKIQEANLSQWFFFENGWSDPNNFFKQFISGALMAIVMTGLDQDMMQKNLTCRTLPEAQKNVFLFSVILIFANILFLTLGAMLYIFAAEQSIAIPEKSDQLFPILAIYHLGPLVAISFIIGIMAAAYSSADSALTALTTSFCIDFLDFEKKEMKETERSRTRLMVHIGFSVILFCVIMAFYMLDNTAVVNGLFKAAGYTYGPLLGLFTFGIIHKNRSVKDNWVLWVCLLAPILSFVLDVNSASLLGGFKFGFLIVAANGLITYLGLWLISYSINKEYAT